MRRKANFHTVSFTFIKYLCMFLFFYQSLFSQTLNNFTWNLEQVPTFSKIKYLKMFSSASGISGADIIMVLKDGIWQKFLPQPPAKPTSIYANNINSIWVNAKTKYQESILYYWNGKFWKKLFCPLANSIYSMKFTDSKNGVISGLGEIAKMTNGKWNYLVPVNNDVIKKVIITKTNSLWILSQSGNLFEYVNKKWEKFNLPYNIRLIKNYGSFIYFYSDSVMGKLNTGNKKIEVIFKDNRLKNINDFSVPENNEIIAAGIEGLILHFVNGRLFREKSNITETLNSVEAVSPKIALIGGDNGVLLSYGIGTIKHTKRIWKGFKRSTFYFEAKEINDEYGVVAVDFNGDGLTDIFTCGLFGQNHLYINKGNFKFIDESEERGLSEQLENKGTVRELNLGACAGDFDNDGNIDLYVSSLNSKNKLYHNLGDGYFVDYSNISGGIGKQSDRTNAVVSGDVDNDGDLDVFIVNENTTNRLYINNGAGIFMEITQQANLISRYGGTGASFSDIDNDGDIDLYVANWSKKNNLYKNLLKETGTLKFVDYTDSAFVGGDAYTKSNGVVFTDIDNDGDPDLFVTNRKTSNKFYLNNGRGKFIDMTETFFGTDTLKSYGVSSADFDGDGLKDLYLANVGKDKFYKNIDGGIFIDNTGLYGAGVNGYGTGTAVADFDNNGGPDLYAANYVGGSSTFLRNKFSDSNFVTLKISGFNNNSSAVGTKIYVYPTGNLDDKKYILYYTEIKAGSGYASCDDFVKIIPLYYSSPVIIKIVFPLGEVKLIKNILPGNIIAISDISGIPKFIAIVKRYFIRLIFDPHRFFEFVKWLFVFFVLSISIYRGKRKFNWTLKNIIISSLIILISYYILISLFNFRELLLSSVLPVSVVLGLIFIQQLLYERLNLKRESELEKQKIRQKLSRDLHDDLASTLSSVTIYLELLKQSLKNNPAQAIIYFNKAADLLNNAKQSVTDMIWTISPKPETISQFVLKVRENFTHLFKEKNIAFSINDQDLINSIHLPALKKHNLYLIIKEALNNIIKYANASIVKINISSANKTLLVKISDNGSGFDFQKAKNKGHGLRNMKERSEEINAEFKVDSTLGKGTNIIVIIK